MHIYQHKNFDQVVVGRNLYSLIWCLLTSPKQKTLLLDDANFIAPQLDEITDLERFFLKTLGAKYDYPGLYNIEDALRPFPRLLHTSREQFFCGGDIALNLQEFFRRRENTFLQKLFPPPMVDSYLKYCRQYCEILFAPGTWQQKILKVRKIIPSSWAELYQRVRKIRKLAYIDLELEEQKILDDLYQWQILFQYETLSSLSEWKFYTLILRRFGGLYLLQRESILEQLTSLFIAKGGAVIHSSIKNFSFAKEKPWGIELDSFMGGVYPKVVHLWGYPEHKLGLGLGHQAIGKEYSFDLQSKEQQEIFFVDGILHEVFPLELYNQRLIKSSFRFVNRKKCEVRIIVKDEGYQEIKTFIHYLLPMILASLARIHGLKIAAEKVQVTRIQEEKIHYLMDEEALFSVPAPLFALSATKDPTPLQQVFYWGPLLKTGIGPMGLLTRIKELAEES